MLIGTWNIVKMSEWDSEYCNMEVQAYILIQRNGHGEFQFGSVTGDMWGEFKRSAKECTFDFTFEGSDEGDDISGDGWMKATDKKNAEGEIRFHGGDKSRFLSKKRSVKKRKE
ncbi:TPA: hypothetical protein HA361_05770 [Candidatus Woesearchaeota archaeon]|nr:hypothetical protein [Candidatus Woesearchaeota archaeon]HII69183.1 hypothetical protein [Candidatus Woesearchaeota archaeon]